MTDDIVNDNQNNEPEQQNEVANSYSWEDAKQDCVDASDEIGAVTGAVYQYGAHTTPIGLNEEGPEKVGDFIGGFVEENWENVCNLPENLSEAFDSIIDKFSSDNSIAIDPANDLDIDAATQTLVSESSVDFSSGNNDPI